MTRLDKFKAMTAEEIAAFMHEHIICLEELCPSYDNGRCSGKCAKEIKEFLNSEIEE